jgi:hypothetical protein
MAMFSLSMLGISLLVALYNRAYEDIGDNGAGIGASHQTGWTGLVANLIQQHGDHPAEAPLHLVTTELAPG